MSIIFDTLDRVREWDQLRGEIRATGIALDDEAGEGALFGFLAVALDVADVAIIRDALDARAVVGGILIEPADGALLGLIDLPVLIASESTPAPEFSLMVGVLPAMQLVAETTALYMDELNVETPPAGLLVEPEGDYLLGVSGPLGGFAQQDEPVLENYGFLQMSPGYVWAFGAVEFQVSADGLRFAESLSARIGAVLADVLVFSEARSGRLNARASAADLVLLGERIGFGFRLILSDSFTLAEAFSFDAGAVEDLVDYLLFSDVVQTRRAALALVVSGLALGDQANSADAELAQDSLEFNETFSDRLAAAAAAVDELLLAESFEHSAGFTVVMAEALRLGDSVSSTAALIVALTEGLRVAGRLRIGGEEFYGYVCNTENRAFSTYANFPFNSMAEIGPRKYFAAADDGLYLLEGDDDGGDPISATVRMAVTSLGTGKQKRMPSAYIGYQGGRVVLKTITTSDTGDKQEHWYAVEPRPANAMRESRIPIGRGLKSVYWGFELVNVAGEPFKLDSLQLFPMILERRL